MTATKSELVELSDQAWGRTRQRVEGLSDEEYHWEPAPGCWSVRERADGSRRWESSYPTPEPAPFTTIAWRLWHLIDMYGEDRAPQWLALEPQGPAVGLDDPDGAPPATAAEAVELLDRAHDRWDRHLALVSESSLRELIGPVGGHYADHTRAAYVLHMLDEFIHHGAEIGVLRDLWAWQRTLTDDPVVERVLRGDPSVLDDLGRDPETSVRDHPDLVARAASHSRWELVDGLLGLGFSPAAPGRTPLHLAAGAGELGAVRLLVEHGADPDATDPEFEATPLRWAEFLGRTEVAEWLRPRTATPVGT